jgi:DNA (cytosine-5)-methyltransferase 1
MKHLEVVKIGNNRGTPRIWIEGRKAEAGGFLPGTRYAAMMDPTKCLLTLEVVESGMRVVSRKAKGAKELPVIDINSNELLSMFAGLDSVRVVVQNRCIHILPIASELRARRRLSRLRQRIQSGERLSFGSTAAGIGILDKAAHDGFALAGLQSKLDVAVEIRDDCMEHAISNNPVYTNETLTVTAPMQEVAFDPWTMSRMQEQDVFCLGIPCSGASIAGRSKRGLEHPESHPEVGHLCVAFLAMMARLNPVACVLECVVPYRHSASMAIIRNQLRDFGYAVHETELDAADWGMLEHRRRFCMVAVTNGIQFSFDELQQAQPPVVRRFGDVMDLVDPTHSTWGRIDYLWNKLARDQQAGKGFSPTIVDANSTRVPTLNKTLHKRQSTGTFIQHPTDPDLYRIPTVMEHARCKGVSEALVRGTTQTFGHEVLGQAISVPPFVAVFDLLAKALKAYGLTNDRIRPVVSRGVAVAA